MPTYLFNQWNIWLEDPPLQMLTSRVRLLLTHVSLYKILTKWLVEDDKIETVITRLLQTKYPCRWWGCKNKTKRKKTISLSHCLQGQSFSNSTVVMCTNPKPHPATRPPSNQESCQRCVNASQLWRQSTDDEMGVACTCVHVRLFVW